MKPDLPKLLAACQTLARRAGDAIMEIYESGDFEVEIKKEGDYYSPLTKADKVANAVIEAGLQQISDYPIISEEGTHSASGGDTFWLVDPIDGTKEFIKRNGEFTVNIGLIQHKQPILGVVYAPAIDVVYVGSLGGGAYKQTGDQPPEKISADYHGSVPTILASRSHMNEDTENFLKKLGKHRTINIGSSLKLCLVAEGTATAYPRFVPTSLWDTAAADAVLRAAGGRVHDLKGQDLTYDPRRDILNPSFIAAGRGQDFF